MCAPVRDLSVTWPRDGEYELDLFVTPHRTERGKGSLIDGEEGIIPLIISI